MKIQIEQYQKTHWIFSSSWCLPFILALFFFTACQPENRWFLMKNFPGDKWPSDSAVRFTFRVDEPSKNLDFIYQVQYADNYPFENIWLDYVISEPNGKTIAHSRDNLMLFEPKSGKPLGTGSSERRFLDAYFLRNISLSQTGQYQVTINHYMRIDSLSGIQSIGLKIRSFSEE